ncbi:MAG: Mur ligase family protein [Chloroflexota bacterium]|nr:Mur ligase family protein [Chloroflexota bacterium]
MRLIEVRLLDGPNVYRLEPAVKVELAIGRRRSWYGQRRPARHAVVRLGTPVPGRLAPPPVALLAAWVRRLHAAALGKRRIAVAIHRTNEPGHWVVAYPWRERGRAEAIARTAYRLTERHADPRRDLLARATIEAIVEADTNRPELIDNDARRVPTICISGTNGKSTTTRLIGHILHGAGRRVGMSTSDGVYVNGVLVEEGDLTGPRGAQRVLGDPSVEVAVLETARGGILLRGLGVASNDAAVLTNVSADHLDLHGLHTLPELAEVKSVIARVTRPDGTVVLNADDVLVAGLRRRVRADVCLFSLRPTSVLVRRHVENGGRALVLDGSWLVELAAGDRRPIVEAAEVPATLGGAARHNVANALAAAGGAMALGATIEQVALGLRTFRPSPDQMPGRTNLYLLGRRVVIVDYAHNEAGLAALLELAEALVGRGRRRATISAVVGTAGDRPDDSLRAIGRLAAERSDQVAIKETLRYLRGRSRQSVIGELLAGIRSAGVRAADVPVYEDEPSAVQAELTTSGRLAAIDDGRARVLLLMCHADRAGVEEVLRGLGARLLTEPGELSDLRDV